MCVSLSQRVYNEQHIVFYTYIYRLSACEKALRLRSYVYIGVLSLLRSHMDGWLLLEYEVRNVKRIRDWASEQSVDEAPNENVV